MRAILKDQTGCRADHDRNSLCEKYEIERLKSKKLSHFCTGDALPSAVLSDNAMETAAVRIAKGRGREAATII